MNKRNNPIIYVEYLLTTIKNFMHNNGLTQQVAVGIRIPCHRDGWSMQPWSENTSLRRV